MQNKIKSYKQFEAEDFMNKSGEDFWGDMGAGVMPIAKSTGRILVGLRSKYVNEPGTWGCFGGMVDDKDEERDPQMAAMREFEEEAGQEADVLEVVPAAVFRSQGGGFEYHNFVCVVKDEFEADLDFETEAAKWVTLDELVRLEDKHFGLEYLMDNSMDIIKKYAR